MLLMTKPQEHYHQLLANRYAWMHGDFNEKATKHTELFLQLTMQPSGNRIAFDLGAGHGLQSFPLAQLGYAVTAVDTSKVLLDELAKRINQHSITVEEGDMIDFVNSSSTKPELIVCAGDTLTHLASLNEVEVFLSSCVKKLDAHGRLFLSFRDYSTPLTGAGRVIPVRQDENRIMTCVLDYEETKVLVTDICWEQTPNGWEQHAGCYEKVRIPPVFVHTLLNKLGMGLVYEGVNMGMCTMLWEKLS